MHPGSGTGGRVRGASARACLLSPSPGPAAPPSVLINFFEKIPLLFPFWKQSPRGSEALRVPGCLPRPPRQAARDPSPRGPASRAILNADSLKPVTAICRLPSHVVGDTRGISRVFSMWIFLGHAQNRALRTHQLTRRRCGGAPTHGPLGGRGFPQLHPWQSRRGLWGHPIRCQRHRWGAGSRERPREVAHRPCQGQDSNAGLSVCREAASRPAAPRRNYIHTLCFVLSLSQSEPRR